MTAAGKLYRGYGNENPAGGRLVTVVDGTSESPLLHIAWHSPSGMTWGYGGSGPADLALSLLVDALGDEVRCRTCGGSGSVMFDPELDEEVPYLPDHDCEPMRCMDCQSGIRRGLPYQEFKWGVVAKLPDSWTLTVTEVRRWYWDHQSCEGEKRSWNPRR